MMNERGWLNVLNYTRCAEEVLIKFVKYKRLLCFKKRNHFQSQNKKENGKEKENMRNAVILLNVQKRSDRKKEGFDAHFKTIEP